jgi:intracellular multiplication protein IcmL
MANSRQHNQVNNNEFYINYFQTFIVGLAIAMFLALILVSTLLYQTLNRPFPAYSAIDPKGKALPLAPELEPNLLPPTLIKWASKAVVAAYTFDFVNYNKELSASRGYFTDAGWEAYKASIAPAIDTVKQNQLFVTGVVVGAPVISHQGDLPGRGYVWQIQLPFLVTYQSAESISRRSFTVTLTIVRVPTWENPTAIGIDQFVMRGPG